MKFLRKCHERIFAGLARRSDLDKRQSHIDVRLLAAPSGTRDFRCTGRAPGHSHRFCSGLFHGAPNLTSGAKRARVRRQSVTSTLLAAHNLRQYDAHLNLICHLMFPK